MTIQRQYSLPNCKLVLQGLSNEAADLSGRPLVEMVTNVECYLAGQKVALAGGRAFLESLATAVSDYAQSYLSGIQHLVRRNRHQQGGLVQLQQVSSNLHRLTAQPEADQPGTPVEVDLTTVQLFDLVEALDQLFADAQTLPDFTLKLNPLPKRYVTSQEPLAKRATPIAVGLTSLAAAAAVLFMLPAPQVRQPEPSSNGTQTSTDAATAGASPGASPSPAATNPTSEPNVTDRSAAEQGAGLNLADAPEITDTAELDKLTVALYDKLDLAWKKTPTFDGELAYRVGVNQDGDIVGYKYTNDAALTYLTDTPLADVQFRSSPEPSNGSSPTANEINSTASSNTSSNGTFKEPVAQFRVVFKSDGVLEVSPWDGQAKGQSEGQPERQSSEPEAVPSP